MTRAGIRFYGVLQELLPASKRGEQILFNPDRNASVKDIIEAHGPPHTEIGEIHLDGVPVDLAKPWMCFVLKYHGMFASPPYCGPSLSFR